MIDYNDPNDKPSLVSPIDFFNNPYARDYIELNNVEFPPLSIAPGMPGFYIPTPDGGQQFVPDLCCHRSYLVELIRNGKLIPSPALIAKLQLQPNEIQPIYPNIDPRPLPNVAIPYMDMLESKLYENRVDDEMSAQYLLDLITPITPGYFSTMPDAIELEKIFVKMYHVRAMESEVFVFCHNHYKSASKATLLKMIRGTFAEVIENPPDGSKRSSNICNKVLAEIGNDNTLEINEADISPTLVAFNNCYFDTATYMLFPITKEYIPEKVVFYAINANLRYIINPDGSIWYDNRMTPFFDKYLYDITGGDPILIDRIYEILGYILTQDTYRKCFFVFQGLPHTGKSTLERLIKRFFVPGTARAFMGMAFDGNFALKELENKALCSCSDLPDKAFNARQESVIKQLTGGDELDTDVKFGRRETFYFRGKLTMFTNNPILVTSSQPEAFFNRAKVVPFAFPVHQIMTDIEFDQRLWAELDGIVTRAFITYLQRYGQPGFIGDELYKINAIYHRGCWKDSLLGRIYNYVKENFVPNPNGKVFIDEAYNDFLLRNGFAKSAIYINKFSSYFQKAAFDLFGAEHDRASAVPNGNPVSCIKGLAFKA